MASVEDDILHPDHRLTRSDAAMLGMLTDSANSGGRRWLRRLSAEHCDGLIAKIIQTIGDLQRGDRQDAKILARLMLVLARLDALDFGRDKLAVMPAAQHNHLHLHGAIAATLFDDADAANDFALAVKARLAAGRGVALDAGDGGLAPQPEPAAPEPPRCDAAAPGERADHPADGDDAAAAW